MNISNFKQYKFISLVALSLLNIQVFSMKRHLPEEEVVSRKRQRLTLTADDLLNAAQRGDLDAVKEAIVSGVDVDTRHLNYNTTALLLAVAGEHLDVVKALINAGANVNLGDKYNHPPVLILATQRGQLEMVKVLIAAGAHVNARHYLLNETALIQAAHRGYLEILEALIDAGADVDARDGFNKTALMRAAQRGRSNIVKVITDKKNLDDLKVKLLAPQANVNIKEELAKAVSESNVYIVEFLLNEYRFDTLLLRKLLSEIKEKFKSAVSETKEKFESAVNNFTKKQYQQIGRLLIEQLTFGPTLRYGALPESAEPYRPYVHKDIVEQITSWK